MINADANLQKVLLYTLETPLESPAPACPTCRRFHQRGRAQLFGLGEELSDAKAPPSQRVLCSGLVYFAPFDILVAHLRPTTNPHNHPGCQLRTKTPCYYNPPQEWGGHRELLYGGGGWFFHTVDIFEKIQFRSFQLLFSSNNHRSQDEQKRFFFLLIARSCLRAGGPSTRPRQGH